MKKVRIKSNFVLLFLVILFGMLSFVSYNVSYSNLNVKNDSNVLTSDLEITLEEAWNFLENVDGDIGFEGNSRVENEVIEEVDSEKDNIVIASKNDKEDPEKEVLKNSALKGVAKETTVKKALQTYETNETSLGIDVSTWQGDIDWKKVKASGINFAMIRVGFRKMDSGQIVMDNQFLDNIKGAIANNINVGVYFFSMAKTKDEAIEEAKWVLNVVKNYDITYPIAIDMEIFNKHRLKGVSNSTLTDNAVAFCDYIKKKGYTPMVFSYLRAFNKYFDTAKFSKYRIWLSQYYDKVTYKGNYHMWQYTSSGKVPGINGRVDMNVAYFSVTNDVTKASTVNGITNTGNLDKVDFIQMNMKTTLNKNVNLRVSPYLSLPNKAGSLDKGTKITVTGMGDKFIRILYDGNTFYVNDINCFVMNLEEVSFSEVDLTVKVNRNVQLLKKPYLFLKNNVYKNLNELELVRVVGLNSEFVKVIIDNEYYYVNDIDFYDIVRDNLYYGSGSINKEHS